MKLKGLSLIVALLSVLQGLCQIDSSKVSNGDVIIISNVAYGIFDSTQVSNMANSLLNLDECSEVRDTLLSVINIQNKRIVVKDSIISNIQEQGSTKDQIIEDYKYQVVHDKNYISELNYDIKQKKIKNTFIESIGGGIVTILVVGLIYSVAK